MRFRNAMSLVNAALALALAATSTFYPAGPVEATALPPEQPQTSTDMAVGSLTNTISASAIDSLATPLSVSLQQSTFDPAAAAGSGLVVTVTVRNNLGPVVAPPLVAGDDITGTVAAMRSVDFAADPNTLRGVILSDQVTHPASDLLDAAPAADQDGDRFVVNLGDVPPLGTAQAVLHLSAPGALADFADLDTGVQAFGNWQGRSVEDSAAPISLAPSGYAQFLVCTVDANCADRYVLRQTAALDDDPIALFQHVRSLGYEAYVGSLRGARGTLWSEAGNGVDQASALVALLRAAGIPAAYRLGTLNQTDAQTLLASMFDGLPATGGHVPAGTPVADPVTDPALIAEAQQHAWVEAYLPGSGWTAMDPAFPAAQPGDVFGVPSGGQLAELPDSLRHKVSFDLAIEKYSEFPIGGANLYTPPSPLSATFNTVELVGEPVVFAHLVDSNTPGGLIYVSVEHTYTPYFVIGESEQLIEGTSFGELISSFPFAKNFVVAEWLDITVTAPGGASETYRRELFDDIGYDARTGSGLVGGIARDETARVSTLSSWATMVATSRLPAYAIDDTYQDMVTLGLDVGDAWDAVSGLEDSNAPGPEVTAASQQAVIAFGKAARLGQKLHLYKFLRASDMGLDYLTDSLRTKSYAATPRVFTLGWERNEAEETDAMSFDLGRNRMRALGYPGQTDAGVQSFNYARGMLDLSLEHGVLDEVSPAPVTSVIAVLDQAELDGVPVSRYTVGTLDELNALPISAEAKARISTALTENPDLNVLVPEAMVTLPGAATPTIGWLLLNHDTMEMIDVMENGLHMAVSYAVLGKFAQKVGSLIGGFGAGLIATTMGFWGSFFSAVPIGPGDIAGVLAHAKQVAADKGKEAEKICKGKVDKKWCKAGVKAGAAAGNAALASADPPLPEMQLNLPFDVTYPATSASAVVNQTAALTGANVSINVTTPLVGVHGDVTEDWSSVAANSFAFESLTVTSADVYQGVTLLGSGIVVAVPASADARAVATSDGSTVAVSASTSGTLSLHGAALSELAAGSDRLAYSATLGSGSQYELALQDAVVSVGGNNYTGDLRLVTSDAVSLAGAGPTAAPNFALNLATTTGSGGYTVADASGTVTVGGNPAPASSGFALGDATGSGSVTGAAGDSDTFVFNGTADFYRLGLSSAASGIPAGSSVNFSASVAANVSDAYTMTVYAPAGWDVSIDTGGQVSAQSPVDAPAGAHEIVVFAQPAGAPDLAVSAVHVATVSPVDGVLLDVAVDPTYTVPWGDEVPGVYDLTVNDGRMQLTGASFAVDLTNASSVDRTYDVVVSGLPAGWSILGSTPGATSLVVPLEAGQKVRLGLHILPTVAALPAIGTNYPFTVVATAQDNGAVTDSDSDSWTLPAVPFPFVQVSPAEQYLGENTAGTFDVTLTNVGNAAGSFDLLAESPTPGWTVSSPASPVALNPGQSATQTLNFSVTTGQRNVDYPFAVSSPAPTTAYTPTTAMLVYLAGPQSAPVYEAGAQVLACTDESALAAAFNSLGGAASELEASCDGGTCSNGLRDSTVAAANALATLVNVDWPTVDTAAVAADAAALGSASGNAAISAALADLSDSAAALGGAVCEAAQHLPSAKFTPSIDAVLLGDSAVYTLTVTNQGSLATTYAVTTTLPTGPDFDSLSLLPGESQPLVYSFTAPALGFQVLHAQVAATGPDVVGDVSVEASAGLNVVNQFVQIMSVTPDPSFVETGVSSTTVRIDVANVANLRREVTARTTILNSGGGTAFTDDAPLTIQPGAPQSYELQMVTTSGWASGVYTVEVALLDAGNALVPDGYGFAPFGVGQALGASHSVSPLVVAPGDVTVTTAITTEILVDTVVPTAIVAAPLWQPTGPRNNSPLAIADGSAAIEESVEPADVILASTDPVTDDLSSAIDNPTSDPHAPLAPAGYTRTESSDPAVTYTGSWSTSSLTPLSGGSAQRSTVSGNTASFSFTGAWVNVGLATTSDSGAVELFLDGASQGIVDLYSNENGNLDIIFDGLSNTTHTIALTTLSAVNPNATNGRVFLDFFDTWDGTPIPNGSLEQDSGNFLYSNNWNTTASGGAVASAGTYARSDNGTAWLPFDGDSISIDVYKYNGAGPAEFFVDGQHLARIDLYSVNPVTETISFTGFGSGLHLLTLRQHQNLITVDRVTTPASTPVYSPPVQTGIIRVEEFDEAVQYNGQPFTTAISSWVYDEEGMTSRGDTAYNGNTAGATVSYDFVGDWVSLGLVGMDRGGQVDVTIDGLLQETIDTYRRSNEPIGAVYSGFGAGAHTVTLTVLPTTNPLSGQNRLYFDYFETWDGGSEPAGTFEADFQDIDRLRYSGGWSLINDPNAAGGSYVRSSTGSVWFHFTGDSVTYEAFAYTGGDLAQVWLDGSYVTSVDLESPVDVTRTLTMESLGAGPHVLLVRAPRGVATADRFQAPAIEPATDLACGAYCRYEDEHPDLRYNGFPLNQAASTFFPVVDDMASNDYVLETRTAGDTVGLAFNGAAVAVGLHAYERGGLVDITIDGALVETVDTYNPDPINLTRFYPLPVSGSHTISVALTGAQNPFALNARLQLDFIDVWDGTALPSGTKEIESAAYVNANWGELAAPVASGGAYRRSQPPVSYHHKIGTVWIPFEGDSVQFDAIAREFDDPYARVFVDGVEQPSINFWNGEDDLRTFAFEGFGPGAHLLQISGERAIIALDTVSTPATQPAHTNPSPVGLTRYEENAFTFDGHNWDKRQTSWIRITDPANGILAEGYSAYEAVRSNQAGSSASLTFDGSWANLGLQQYGSGGTAEIYLDGVLTRTINLNGSFTLTETQLAFTPGNHTISVSVVGDGQVVLDFLDVYDDTPVADGLIDAWLGDPQANTRIHYSNTFSGVANPEAIGDSYMTAGTAVWYTFVGDSFTFYGFGNTNNSSVDVFIDNQLVDTVSLKYSFTNSPLAFHYNGLSNGPHSVRIEKGGNIRADAFASPATNTPYLPIVEWNGPEAGGNALDCGICSGFTAGDINDDGIVELVFGSDTSSGHKLFVYRGDGGDTGDGDAVIWSDAYGSGDIGSPALGELDPAYAGTEIVAFSNASLRVYHADGTLWWEDTSITMNDYIGAVTLGNLDADPEPEIVVNAREELIVLDADGAELWSVTKATSIGIPLLADMTGDGVLDIVFSEYGKTSFPTKPAYVYLYDFNLGTPSLVWTHTLITAQVGLFGSMAVADVDGQQPGGDPDPEIAVSSDGNLTVLNDDGSVLWTIPLDPGEPGGVSIADIDGDGEIEIITGMRHEFETNRFGKLYAVNADSSLLWSVIAEDSTSANSAAVLDLNGDGIYEIAWNGLQYGFNIFNGLDGSVLFNDPTIYTRSGTDYPIIVDVDGDGSAEIVIATQSDGVVVLGFDGMWGQARSLWNQHAYHITNVNDDLTIPDTELNSWAIHNTYKTQYPGEVVLPIFGVNISHTVGTDGLSVTDFSVPPNVSADPTYQWDFVQTVSSPVVIRTLDLALTNLAPGEARLVAAGTTISYTLGSGSNTLHLPPLWVAAPHIVALAPETQNGYAGSTASFDVVLSNPAAAGDTYTMSVSGLPAEWSVSLPASVAIGPGATVTETLLIPLPQDALGDYPLTVAVENGAGGADQASGLLQVSDALDIAITPATQESAEGVSVQYSVVVTNNTPAGTTVALAVTGLDDHAVTLASSLPVPANGSATTTLTVTPQAGPRAFGFAVTGTAASGAADSAQAVLDVVGLRTVAVSIDPASAAGGPGSPAQFTVTVTNSGTLSDTYTLDVTLPGGWSYALTRNGAPVNSVSLPPLALNSVELLLLVTPPLGAAAGSAPFTVSAESTELAGVTGSDTAEVDVLTRGVTTAIAPQATSLSPTANGAWNVTVTNRGSLPDTYNLSVSGLLAGNATLASSSVSLNPGQSQVVALSSGPLPFVHAGPSLFTVTAESTGDSRIRGEDDATVTFDSYEAVSAAWEPISQTVSSLSATFTLLVTNTGNIATTYTFDVSGAGLTATPQLDQYSIPAHSSVAVLVTLTASGVGTFPFTGTATSNTRSASGSAEGTLVVTAPLAVTLAQFDATQQRDRILVTWETTSEVGNLGFNLWRGISPSGPDQQLNSTLIPSQSPGGLGGFLYTWEDQQDLTPGTDYYYWLEDVDISGAVTRHGPVNVTYTSPTAVTVSGLSAGSREPGVISFWWIIVAGFGMILATGITLQRRRQRRSL